MYAPYLLLTGFSFFSYGRMNHFPILTKFLSIRHLKERKKESRKRVISLTEKDAIAFMAVRIQLCFSALISLGPLFVSQSLLSVRVSILKMGVSPPPTLPCPPSTTNRLILTSSKQRPSWLQMLIEKKCYLLLD